jgi:hypothetical protein
LEVMTESKLWDIAVFTFISHVSRAIISSINIFYVLCTTSNKRLDIL